MNPTSKTYSASFLTSLAQRLFVALGTPDDLATIVATSLVSTNLAGHDSHGVIQIPIYAAAVQAGRIKPAARASVAPATAMLATLAVDGAFGWGPPAACLTVEKIAERAQQFGISTAVIRNCHHIGRVGQYVERLAAQNLIGIAMCNASRAVVPFNGRQRMLGTNPIAVAVPRQHGQPPVLFDGSTSIVAGNKIKVLLDKGLPTPAGWIVDSAGQPSTRPADFFDGGGILSMGGHKGYGLGVMVELLGGLLSGASAAFLPDYAAVNGVLMIAFRPDAFMPLDDYLAQVDRACAALKASPGVDDNTEVLLPGEPEQRAQQERAQNGIPIPEATWQAICDLADRLSLAV